MDSDFESDSDFDFESTFHHEYESDCEFSELPEFLGFLVSSSRIS